MELFESGWGLSLIVFLPLLGAVALLMVPKENESLVKQLALTVSVVTFGLSLLLIAPLLALAADLPSLDTPVRTAASTPCAS